MYIYSNMDIVYEELLAFFEDEMLSLSELKDLNGGREASARRDIVLLYMRDTLGVTSERLAFVTGVSVSRIKQLKAIVRKKEKGVLVYNEIREAFKAFADMKIIEIKGRGIEYSGRMWVTNGADMRPRLHFQEPKKKYGAWFSSGSVPLPVVICDIFHASEAPVEVKMVAVENEL